jgi:hypothetical protein
MSKAMHNVRRIIPPLLPREAARMSTIHFKAERREVKQLAGRVFRFRIWDFRLRNLKIRNDL